MLDAGDQISKIIDVNVTKLQHWYKLIEIETITFSHRTDDCGRKGRYERLNCTQLNILLLLKNVDRQTSHFKFNQNLRLNVSLKRFLWIHRTILANFDLVYHVVSIIFFFLCSHRKIFFFSKGTTVEFRIHWTLVQF